MQINKCFYCMEDMQPDQNICPHCGRRLGENPQPEYALPCGTILGGKYLIGAVLGQGGFGITYIGFDLLLESKVAIKEYYPMAMANRSTSGSIVWSTYGIPREVGCSNFLKEARKMAKLKNIPEVVSVSDILNANNTAYIVMDFIEGETMKEKLTQNGVMSYGAVIDLLSPIMQAMGKAHAQGIIHRDISPDNIMIGREGRAVLLDLGAAKDKKDADICTEHELQTSTLIHKDGFSPPEQYLNGGNVGPWTDVYAMSATIYYSITGKLLPAAIERVIMNQEIVFPDQVPQPVRKVLLRGLELDYVKRYQSMDELRAALLESADPRATQYHTALTAFQNAKTLTDYKKLEKTFKNLNGYKDSDTLREKCSRKISELGPSEPPHPPIIRAFVGAAAAVAVLVCAVLFIRSSGSESPAVTEVPATAATESEKVERTESALGALNSLQDSPSPVVSPSPTMMASDSSFSFAFAEVGDIVTFGTYEQDNDTSNGAEQVEWLVLDKTEDRLLLISEYGLDARQYNEELADVTWETCTLRAWLNSDFYNTAFSETEQAVIATTEVASGTNPKYGTDAGNATQDRLFLLSINEINQYFSSDAARVCLPTAYAVANDVEIVDNGETWFWLRSPGENSSLAARVRVDGAVGVKGLEVNDINGAVRPAMWLWF